MSARKLWIIGLICAATLMLSACGAFDPFTAEEVSTQSFSVDAAPSVVVETFNGGIEFEAGADGNVEVRATRRGSGASQSEAATDLDNVEISMTQEGDTIHIVARRIDNRLDTGNSGASFELTVPAGSSLEVRTSNGHITVDDVVGGVFARTSNGRIEIRDGEGRIDASTSNGEIEIEANDAQVTTSTSNGRIEFTGTLADGNHSFSTSNGAISIVLPANASFNIDAATSNGSVSSDFAVTVSGRLEEDELHGSVGDDPRISIDAHTSNGSIDIRRKS